MRDVKLLPCTIAYFVVQNVTIPFEASYGKHVFHQYTIRLNNRDEVARRSQ